jgi:hypothetical protein
VSRTRRPRGATWKFFFPFLSFFFFSFFPYTYLCIYIYIYIYKWSYFTFTTGEIAYVSALVERPTLLALLDLLYLLQFFTTGGLTLLLLQERLRTRLPSWSDLLYLLYFTYFTYFTYFSFYYRRDSARV